jgi:hypothetical protein
MTRLRKMMLEELQRRHFSGVYRACPIQGRSDKAKSLMSRYGWLLCAQENLC